MKLIIFKEDFSEGPEIPDHILFLAYSMLNSLPWSQNNKSPRNWMEGLISTTSPDQEWLLDCVWSDY